MGSGEIWVCSTCLEAGSQIKKEFESSNFLNPVRVIDGRFDFRKYFGNDGKATEPLLLLIDLGLPHGKAWEIVESIRDRILDGLPAIALVDDSTELLLDRAFEAGMKTYVRKPLRFAEFIGRTRLVNLTFAIQRPDAKP